MKESEFDYIVNQAKYLILQRNLKYGDSWKNARLSSLLDYVLMKYNRLNKMVDKTDENYDKIKSDLLDVLNYSVFALLKLEEQKK